jgi:hypothetical protein
MKNKILSMDESFPITLEAGLKGKVAVVRMWADLKTAEDEVIARIGNTCDLLGLEMLIIDTAGKLVNYPHSNVTSEHVDFVIHLHFETPKTYDAFSFVTLWNPLDFYFEWGYRKYSENLLTHDDFLSCGSESADDHIRRQIENSNGHLEPELNLFHSLPEPYYEPNLGEQKLFYVGINWEKLGKGVGRHDDLLKALDATDDLAIYGPKIFHGVDVWEGYSSYVGPIPFDGTSAIKAIHKAGISLALSSQAHKNAGLMSSRLFESLAAGAVIIVDENPFAKKHFGDTLLYIKTENVDAETVTNQVRKHLDWIEDNKEEAILLAKSAQKIFLEKFDMSISMKNIYAQLPERKKALNDKFSSRTNELSLTVFGLLLKYDKDKLQHLIDMYHKQTYENKKLIVVIDEQEYSFHKEDISDIIKQDNNITLNTIDFYKRDDKLKIVEANLFGASFYSLLKNIAHGELVSLLPSNEEIFSDHYSSLIRAFEDDKELQVAYSDVLLKHSDEEKVFFDLSNHTVPFCSKYNQPNGMSRILFKVSNDAWLKSTLPYMDWSVIDAIFAKAKNRQRISKATSTIDINNLVYNNMDRVSLDAELVMDSMSSCERKSFLLERLEDQGLTEADLRHQIVSLKDKRIKFNTYSIEERQEVIAHLLESLKLPKWFMSMIRKTHSMFSKNK